MGIAEALAAISAAMQAIDLYSKFGGSSDQVIQSLNLEYRPERYAGAETRILVTPTVDPSTGVVYNLTGQYVAIFAATKGRVDGCMRSFIRAINDDLLPDEREKLGKAARACVCREIGIIRDFMRGALPPELAEIAKTHGC